jgi:hypothetical protein
MRAMPGTYRLGAVACKFREGSSSFFAKKEPKKLLFTAGFGDAVAIARRSKSFLVLFFK